MGLSDRLPGTWLPEDVDKDGDGRPIRPDLPWLRNLSWEKLHAMQIGFGVGLIVFWAQTLGYPGVGFGVAVLVALMAFGVLQRRSSRSNCEHSLGLHDLRHKPWYGITAAFWTWVGAWVFVVYFSPV